VPSQLIGGKYSFKQIRAVIIATGIRDTEEMKNACAKQPMRGCQPSSETERFNSSANNVVKEVLSF
jgi:hypothetical protein